MADQHPLNFRSVEGLLESLNLLIPKNPPDINDPERLIWFKAGQRSIVDMLLFQKERADKEDIYHV